MPKRPSKTALHGQTLLPALGTMAAFSVGVAMVPPAIVLLPGAVGASLLAARMRRGLPPTIAGVAHKTAKDVVEGPRFQLVAMPINHFGEKLRWALDLLEVDYEEATVGGLLSMYGRGRTVPWLVDRHSGSVLGNSDEALWFVGAVCGPLLPEGARERAAKLVERTEATRAWENRLNALGHAVQGWAYYDILARDADPTLSLRYWGAYEPTVPASHRVLLQASAPALKAAMRVAFKLDSERARTKRRAIIDACLDAADAALASNDYLTGANLSYVDLAFCALLAPLLGNRVIASHWARGRFSSFSEFPGSEAFSPHIQAFEAHFASRPCGEYVVRTFETWRHRSLRDTGN